MRGRSLQMRKETLFESSYGIWTSTRQGRVDVFVCELQREAAAARGRDLRGAASVVTMVSHRPPHAKFLNFLPTTPPNDTPQSPSSLKGQGSNDPTTQFTFFELFFWFSTEKKL